MAALMRGILQSACQLLAGGGCAAHSNDDDDHLRRGSEKFRMPLHYPRYRKGDYEAMEEWRLDVLLGQYGLSCKGSLDEKRSFAIGAFLWPDQFDR